MAKRRLSARIKFAVQARGDELDEETLAVLRDAGCVHLEIGFESASDRLLGLMNKGCTVAQNCAAVDMVKRSGIGLQLNIVCGVPGETE